MMTFEFLIKESFSYCGIMPFLVALICVLINRLAGRTEEPCPTWKDKLQMAFIYFLCLFINIFVIWLLMMYQEVWFIDHYGIKL